VIEVSNAIFQFNVIVDILLRSEDICDHVANLSEITQKTGRLSFPDGLIKQHTDKKANTKKSKQRQRKN